MDSQDVTRIHAPALDAAFLVVQRGAALLEVVELSQGGRLTVGRANTNRIVLQDPKCSREHCEIFFRSGQWWVRDLDSRNGLTVDDRRVLDDHPLQFGEVIGIGACTIVLVQQHPDHSAPETGKAGASRGSGYHIIERQSGTQYDNPAIERGRNKIDGATNLFRLARMMAGPTTVDGLCRVVLEGILSCTSTSLGGILLYRDWNVGSTEPVETDDFTSHPQEDQTLSSGTLHASEISLQHFKTVALQGCEDPEGLSSYLSKIVLRDQAAILAHDITGHSAFAAQESLQNLAAESAICAPIRHRGRLYGIIHLYSRNSHAPLTQHDLEFVLAVADQLGDQLHSLLRKEQLEQGLEKTRQQISNLYDQLGCETSLVGYSSRLDSVKRAIARVAPTDALVLIRGESGVGKELVARAVHFNSPRRDGPYICVNCAALTESLLESELFGHEKGAFTGATSRRSGKFEQAHGGTLFLDEIGEMSPEIQAKFLRVLEGQAFERVGGGDPIQVDVRVVTATNRDLEQAVLDGTFRRDLFFRLQVIEIIVPPLREHPEDIPAIAQHFIERFNAKSAFKIRGFGSEALRKLQAHNWPGNVRELRNVVERAVILSDHEVLQPEDIVLTSLRLEQPAGRSVENPEQPPATALETSVDPLVDLFGSFIQQETSLDELDRCYIEAVLEATRWNKSRASRILQIERTTLDRRLKKYGINRPDSVDGDEDE